MMIPRQTISAPHHHTTLSTLPHRHRADINQSSLTLDNEHWIQTQYLLDVNQNFFKTHVNNVIQVLLTLLSLRGIQNVSWSGSLQSTVTKS